MAKVFLDTNILIDVTQGRVNRNLIESLDKHETFISPLSVHILFYSHKIKVPSLSANATISQFEMVDLTSNVINKSVLGPSSDLEDNIQLHSASEAECNIFLTSDKNLLKLGYFGKTRISDRIS